MTVAPGETFSAAQEIYLVLPSSANTTVAAESPALALPAIRNTTAASPVEASGPSSFLEDGDVAEADSPSEFSVSAVAPSPVEGDSIAERDLGPDVQTEASSATSSRMTLQALRACIILIACMTLWI